MKKQDMKWLWIIGIVLIVIGSFSTQLFVSVGPGTGPGSPCIPQSPAICTINDRLGTVECINGIWGECTIDICTMDTKICPDGSYVSRIPPSCEFADCPIISGNCKAGGFKIGNFCIESWMLLVGLGIIILFLIMRKK